MTGQVYRILVLSWRAGPQWFGARLILLPAQALLPLVSLYYVSQVIDTLARTKTAAAFDAAAVYIALAAGAALLTVMCNAAATLVGQAQAQIATDSLEQVLHRKSIEVDLEYYENSDYYDSLHRAQREVHYRPARILDNAMRFARQGISLAGVAVLLVTSHPAMGLVLIASALPAALVRIWFSRAVYDWSRATTPVDRRASYFSSLLTGGPYAKELRLFETGPVFTEQCVALRAQLRGERLRLLLRVSGADVVGQILSTAAFFGAFALLAYRAAAGALSVGALVLYYQATYRAVEALRETLYAVSGLYEDGLFLSNLEDFLRVTPRVGDPPPAGPVPRSSRATRGFGLEDVGFRYPSSTRHVLRGVSLTVRPGERIAIVGPNGSGKSTLVKLLCRLYDPTEGRLTLDGVDYRHMDVNTLRRNVNVIFQDYVRYDLTARENIRLGDVQLAPDDQRIEEAARQAGVDDLVRRLPRGYDTMLGKRFAGGEELSIGEWQKLALARAFLRPAQLVVLDEPTSAMDARAEHELFRRFYELADGRGAILISHRLATVKQADCIYVLNDGELVESGNHEQLMRRGGAYACLFDTQAQHYR